MGCAFKEAFELSHVHAVVGILGEKDALGIFEVLREEYVDSTDATFRLYLSASESSRAIAPEELQEIALDAGFDENIITVYDHLDEALAIAMENALFEQETAGVLVTGSVTVIGEARTLLAQPAQESTAQHNAEPEELAEAAETDSDELFGEIMAELAGEEPREIPLEDSLGLPLADGTDNPEES